MLAITAAATIGGDDKDKVHARGLWLAGQGTMMTDSDGAKRIVRDLYGTVQSLMIITGSSASSSVDGKEYTILSKNFFF